MSILHCRRTASRRFPVAHLCPIGETMIMTSQSKIQSKMKQKHEFQASLVSCMLGDCVRALLETTSRPPFRTPKQSPSMHISWNSSPEQGPSCSKNISKYLQNPSKSIDFQDIWRIEIWDLQDLVDKLSDQSACPQTRFTKGVCLWTSLWTNFWVAALWRH